jgi:hypothetical protein
MLIKVLVALFLLTTPAMAQGRACAPLDEFLTHLKATYNEEPTGSGVSNDGMLYVVTRGPASWSLIAVGPTKVACIISAGDIWFEKEVTAKGST